ncbi:MAG: hypothetical protein ACXWFX_09655 [Methylobacter sp.]
MSNTNKELSDKDFDALLKKWLHHDRLLNDRERYYLLLQAGIFGILSYLFTSKGVILIIAPLLLLITIWVSYFYYKFSQEVDYFYRNAFDKEMSAYVRKIIKIDESLVSKDCDWATRFIANTQSEKIKNTSLSLFEKLEREVEKRFLGNDLDFKNEHPLLMKQRIRLMLIIAIVESIIAIVVLVRGFWLLGC